MLKLCDGPQSEINYTAACPTGENRKAENTAGSELLVNEKTPPMFGLIFKRHVNKTDDTDLSDVVKEHTTAQDD